MDTRVLVTGATGFLGGSLARALHKLGYAVTATGRNESYGEKLREEGIAFIPCDLADGERIVPLCAGQDFVFHCGARSSTWGPYSDFYNSNVIGTRNILEGCRRYEVGRLIYVSTPSLYSDYTDRLNVSESAPLPSKAVNAYADTKLLAEREVDLAFSAGIPVITIRPRAIFGPGDQAILPRLLQASRQGRVPLINGGQALIDMTYIDNVVDALLKCMTSPEATLGKKYNITNGEPLPFLELMQRLFAQLEVPLRGKQISYRTAYAVASLLEWKARLTRSQKEPVLTRSTIGMLGKSLTLDITAAREELNYVPLIGMEEGVTAYVAWIKEQDSLI